jgi:hypothetical protein
MMFDPATTTVQDVVDFIAANVDHGCICPCCGRYAKLYRRRMYAGMAATLVHIYRKFRDDPPEGGWLHVEQYLKSVPNAPPQLRGDYHKLRFWGLLERRPGPSPAGDPVVGRYRITTAGSLFARNQSAVASYVHIYQDAALEFSGDPVNVVQVLVGGGFDYQELLEG